VHSMRWQWPWGSVARAWGSTTARVLLPLAAALALVWGFADFVSFALNANRVLNSLIVVALALGVWLVLVRAREVDRDAAQLAPGLAAVREGDGAALDRLARTPMGGALARLGSSGAADVVGPRRLAPGRIDEELALAREQYDVRQEPAQYLVGMMVGLGLLGTFIGLLDTLVRATEVLRLIGRAQPGRGEGVLEAVFLQMVMALEGPLTSMGTAFSASMFGLVGSLVLGLMMVVLRRATNDVLGRARDGMFKLAGPAQAELSDADGLRQFVTAMAHQNQRLALFVEDTAQQAVEQHEAIAALVTHSAQGQLATQALLDHVAESVSRQQLVVGQVVASVQALADCLERQSGAMSGLPVQLDQLLEHQQAQWLACNGQLEQLRRSLVQVHALQAQATQEHEHTRRVLASRQG
jgi:hypothetical protein